MDEDVLHWWGVFIASVVWIPTWNKLGMMMHSCNPSINKVERGGSKVQGYPQLYRESKTSLGYLTKKKKIIIFVSDFV